MKVLHVVSPGIDGGESIVGACWSAIMLANSMVGSPYIDHLGIATKLSSYELLDPRIDVHEIEVKPSRINKDIIVESLKIYETHKYDVMHIHVHSLSVIKWIDLLLPETVNIVYTLHTPTMLGRSSVEYGPHGLSLSKKKNVIIAAPSDYMQRVWSEFCGGVIPPEEQSNLVTVYNGTNYDKVDIVPYENREDYVVVCCRVDPMKRILETLRALAEYQIPTVYIGDFWTTSKSDYYSDEVKSIIESTDTIKWIPRLSNKEVKDYIRKSKALVTLSNQESFGLTTAEAISVGTPVLYSTGGAVEEVMEDGVTGIKVEFPYRSTWKTRNKLVNESYLKLTSTNWNPNDLVSFYESHYTIDLMVRNYIDQYSKLMEVCENE